MSGNAIGAQKMAAKRLGMSLEDYQSRISAGLKWCMACRAWKPRDDFDLDAHRGDGRASRCSPCRSAYHRKRHVPIPAELSRRGLKLRDPARDGDKLQARRRINHEVELGVRPHPNALHCSHCGHLGEDRRHEYHHHMGYAAEHHCDVIPLCTTCHHAAERAARG